MCHDGAGTPSRQMTTSLPPSRVLGAIDDDDDVASDSSFGPED